MEGDCKPEQPTRKATGRLVGAICVQTCARSGDDHALLPPIAAKSERLRGEGTMPLLPHRGPTDRQTDRPLSRPTISGGGDSSWPLLGTHSSRSRVPARLPRRRSHAPCSSQESFAVVIAFFVHYPLKTTSQTACASFEDPRVKDYSIGDVENPLRVSTPEKAEGVYVIPLSSRLVSGDLNMTGFTTRDNKGGKRGSASIANV